jgi:ribose 5-phosphate isomerase A
MKNGTRTGAVDPKQMAAERGASLVESGMVLGLGSGSTATLAVLAIGRRLREGNLRNVIGVPSSSAIAAVARESGVPLTTLEEHPVLDLDLDGADEVDPNLNLIKGLGGALLWEKVVAAASRRVVIFVDESKLVDRLGTKAPLPVEVIPFGWRSHLAFIQALGGKPELRTMPDGRPFVTEEGNYILHCRFDGITDPAGLDAKLLTRAGVVGTGLFLGIAHQVIIGRPSGVEVRNRNP